MKLLAGGIVMTAALAVVAACSDDKKETPAAEAPSCTAIVEACHPLDKGTGAIHECHENAEATTATEATCAARKGECLATCKGDGGA